MSVALILSRGEEPALTAVGQFYQFYLFRVRASNVRGKRIKRGEPLTFADTSILQRAWLASLDSLTLIWYISPRLRLATLMDNEYA